MSWKHDARRLYADFQRGRTLKKWSVAVASGDCDPKDYLGIPIGEASGFGAAYFPIPKAANTSIRTALLPCFGIDPTSVQNVHQDSRIPKASSKAIVRNAGPECYMFTVVRHPAERILSAYRNKIGKEKRWFGHAKALGVLPDATFDEFLERLMYAPRLAIDSHFCPQVDLLYYPLKTRELSIYKNEILAAEWPKIANRIKNSSGRAPAAVLESLNQSRKTESPSFTQFQRRLIEAMFYDDFEKFGYDW